MTSALTVRYPSWYDGLMLAAAPESEDLDTFLESQIQPKRPLGLMILESSEGRAEAGLRFHIQ